MDANDLRICLQNSDNKLAVFSNPKLFEEYRLTVNDLCQILSDFFTDAEKATVLMHPKIKGLRGNLKMSILNTISDNNIKAKVLLDKDFSNDFYSSDIVNLCSSMDNNTKKMLIHNEQFVKEHLVGNNLCNLILTLDDDSKIEILKDNSFLSNELSSFYAKNIELSLSDDKKIEYVLENSSINVNHKIEILSNISAEKLSTFLVNHQDFLVQNDLSAFSITKELSVNSQLDLAKLLPMLNLPTEEKLKIIATFSAESKEKLIEMNALSDEYKGPLYVETSFNGAIKNIDSDISNYKGLDDLIVIEPENFTNEQKAKLLKICEICPNLSVMNRVGGFPSYSYGKEYIEGEKWIASVISSINPEYTDAQKLALIDNAIGKKISYTPNFHTEVFNGDSNTPRALWKIISNEHGICNGIATLEQYMLQQVGINSKPIITKNHAFLELINIELPTENNEKIRGNTLIDPTWNLTNHRFNGFPNCFCLSYEDIRKFDIDANGLDQECHKYDELLQDQTISLDEQSLRNIFVSVDLANKDGFFPIGDFFNKSDSIYEEYPNDVDNIILKNFELLKEYCPEFATCQNSTMSILSQLIDPEKLNMNKCIFDIVYDKSDKSKNPVIYSYMDLGEKGKRFFYADQDKSEFVRVTQEEFENKFECYDSDLQKSNGKRPWEQNIEMEANSLSQSSGTISKDMNNRSSDEPDLDDL